MRSRVIGCPCSNVVSFPVVNGNLTERLVTAADYSNKTVIRHLDGLNGICYRLAVPYTVLVKDCKAVTVTVKYSNIITESNALRVLVRDHMRENLGA